MFAHVDWVGIQRLLRSVMRTFLLFIGLMFGCFSVAGAKDASFVDGVAAVVNEHVITVGDLSAAVEPMERRISAPRGSVAYREEMKKLFVGARDALIEKFLILDCEDASKIQIPEWYVDRRVSEIIKDSFAGDRTKFMNILARDRQTFEQWRGELKDHITISSIRTMKIEQNVSVSPLEIEAFYKKEKDRFVVPGRVRISMIVLERGDSAEDPKALAEILKQRVEKGEKFELLAKKYSSGTYADNGGDWGWIEPSILRKDLREATDGMKVGEVGIVQGGAEVYLFRLEARKDTVEKSFKDVQPIVERELKRVKADEEARVWLDLLRKKAFIKISEVKL